MNNLLLQAPTITKSIMNLCYSKNDMDSIVNYLDETVMWIGFGKNDISKNYDDIIAYCDECKKPIDECCAAFFSCGILAEEKYTINAFTESSCLVYGSASLQLPNEKLSITASFSYKIVGDTIKATLIHISAMPASLQLSTAQKDEQLKVITDSISGGLKGSLDDENYSFFYVSEGLCKTLGYTLDEFMEMSGGTAVGAVYPPDLEQALASCAEWFAKGDKYCAEYRIKKKDGSLIWVMDSGQKSRDANGVVHINSILTDITFQKQVALEREATYDAVPCGIAKILISNQVALVEANNGYYNLLYSDIKSSSDFPMESVYQDDREATTELIMELAKQAKPISTKFRAKKNDETIIWIQLEGNYMGTQNGFPLYSMVLLDITAQKNYQDKVAKERERYRTMLESSTDTMFEYTIETDMMLLYYSAQSKDNSMVFPNFCGSIESIDFIHPNDKAAVIDILKNRKIDSAEIRITDGSELNREYIWVLMQSAASHDEENAGSIIGSFRNINRIKQMEHENLQIQAFCNYAIRRDYEHIAKININTNTYEVYTPFSKDSYDFPEVGNYNERAKYYNDNFVLETDREAYISNLMLAPMVKSLNSNKNNDCTFLYREKNMHWQKARFGYFDDDHNSIILSVRDVHAEMVEQQKEQITDRCFDIAAQNMYREFCQINITQNTCVIISFPKGTRKETFYNLENYDAALKKKAAIMLHPNDVAEYVQTFCSHNIMAQIQAGTPYLYVEYRQKDAKGEYRYTASTMVHAVNSLDSDVIVMSFIMDIEQRKRKESDEQRLEKRFSFIFKSNCTSYMEVDIKTKMFKSYVNDSPNVRRGEINREGNYDVYVRQTARTAVLPEYQQAYVANFLMNPLIEKIKNIGSEYVFEYGLKDSGGYTRYFSTTATLLPDSNGDEYLFIYNKDVTKRKLEELNSKQKESEYSFSIAALYEEFFHVNLMTGYYFISKSSDCEEIIANEGSFSRAALLYIKEFIFPEDQEIFAEYFSTQTMLAACRSGEKQICKEVRRKIKGKYKWVEYYIIPIPVDKSEDLRAICTYRDIDDLKNLQETQRITNLRFNRLFRNSYDEVFEADLNTDELSSLHFTEDGVQRIRWSQGLKRTCEDIMIKNIHPHDRGKYRQLFNGELLKAAFDEGINEIHYECRRLDGDGKYHWYSYLTQRVSLSDDNNNSIISFMKNIDSVKIVEEKHKQVLKDALYSAEQANNAKSEFLSRMSHDIRTPMNAIIGMTSIAATDIENHEHTADCLVKISRSAKFLLSLINDILDMSKIESGKLLISNENFFLNDMIQDMIAIVYPQAKKNGVNFDVQIKGNIQDEYLGDSLHLHQILINILSNAVKFTPRGGSVRFTFGEISKDKKTATVRFIVQDTGVGMSPRFMKVLFNPFEQENENTVNKLGGTGLGLSISKNLISLMNGSINVESAVNVGSTFTVDIPLAIVKESNKKYNIPTLDNQMLSTKVLIVDENSASREYDAALLNNEDIHGGCVAEEYDAIREINSAKRAGQPYNLVIIDCKMDTDAAIDSVSAIRKLVDKDETAIVISAFDRLELENSAIDAGADFFIAKPILRCVFCDALQRLIHPDMPIYRQKNKRDYDFAGKRVLLVEDNELNLEIAKTLLEEKKAIVETAENGQIAIDKFAASTLFYYDAILMDIRMPVKSGLAATKEIRQFQRQDAQDLPIIAMTADAFKADEEKSQKSGMSAHLAKPIDIEQLYLTLDKFLN